MNMRGVVMSFFMAVSNPGISAPVDCTKLGPNKVVSREFLLQFHNEQDAFLSDNIEKYGNLDLHGIAELFNHILAHGVKKQVIAKALIDCQASNIRVDPD